VTTRFARGALPLGTGVVCAVGGTLAAWHYHHLGLTLAHYDARGHLVVARRIIDNITPGWQQIGGVWLPLPHLLNALPVQIDFFYRTGASAVAMSIAAFAVACGAIAWIVLALTDSIPASIAATAVFALNPNVVYLQSTPMTEPLLLATTTVAVAMLMAWNEADLKVCPARGRVSAAASGAISAASSADVFAAVSGSNAGRVGWAFALACLTRYEAWPVTVSALAAAAWTRWRCGDPAAAVGREIGEIAIYPAAAIAGFAIFSRVVIGQWFVGADFFVPENKALGDAVLAAKEIGWGTETLSGSALTWIGAAGLAIALASGLLAGTRVAEPVALRTGALARRLDNAAIAVSLATMAAIPWVAFLRGHPFRIRYMVPLMAIEAIGAGLASACVPGRRIRTACAAALLTVAVYQLRPLDPAAPMVAEAQWDVPNVPERARVTACIGRLEPGAKIMASMGSLGHYMQEASRSGLALRDFLHEGNGDIWLAALERPQPFADWMLIEEKAQGGDMLAKLAREKPAFLAGYERLCEGAGMVLYRRVTKSPITDTTDADRTHEKNE
jgi:hypothetical protein